MQFSFGDRPINQTSVHEDGITNPSFIFRPFAFGIAPANRVYEFVHACIIDTAFAICQRSS